MKKILVVTAVLVLVGCGEKKPLTPEEQWQGYCRKCWQRSAYHYAEISSKCD